MYHKSLKNKEKIFSVAPMMDWTDRHCRFFHRQLTQRALLYTEMVTADAVIHGDRERLIGFDAQEHPVALQLGSNDPVKLAEAAKIGVDYGYDEINLNVGCPSDRVQNGTFGACLMREPDVVARSVEAMKRVVAKSVTVKCRLGVDDQDTEIALDALADTCVKVGVDAFWVHARKAWLQGLSPKENRDVPPLDYERVDRLKERLPNTFIGINGGITSVAAAKAHLNHVDGVMLGRAAYQDTDILLDVDHLIYGDDERSFDWQQLCSTMMDYCECEMIRGTRLSAITRHMIGLFRGQPGARRFRQVLSEEVRATDAGPDIIAMAFAEVPLTRMRGEIAQQEPEPVLA